MNAWVAKDGQEVPISWSNSCTLDRHGEVVYVVATGLNITKLKRAAKTLEATGALLQSNVIGRVLGDAEDGEGQLLDANDAFLAILEPRRPTDSAQKPIRAASWI
jgi:PAS domain-containing protein